MIKSNSEKDSESEDSERSESEIGILFQIKNVEFLLRNNNVMIYKWLIPFLNQRRQTELEFLVRLEFRVRHYHPHHLRPVQHFLLVLPQRCCPQHFLDYWHFGSDVISLLNQCRRQMTHHWRVPFHHQN